MKRHMKICASCEEIICNSCLKSNKEILNIKCDCKFIEFSYSKLNNRIQNIVKCIKMDHDCGNDNFCEEN